VKNLKGTKSNGSLESGLAHVRRLRDRQEYDHAMAAVEQLIALWPGNPQLYTLLAALIQLQEKPSHKLENARKALEEAVAMDRNSPQAAVELGYYLDAVEDDPKAASRAFANGIATARRLLIDGLLGQARALTQLHKRDEAFRCLTEALYLADIARPVHQSSARDRTPGPFASKVEDLLSELFPKRSA
jgi:tetratricopeptide (TPR) repeat protein